ncbi:flagellar biosynthetic protein FliQ [Clostridia bacterium]|nr:flagellar biosynthetic protein FliQ [Clostridia bacterium]
MQMTEDFVLEVFTAAIKLAFTLAAPTLIVASIVGLAIAILQAATQIHEQTMTFAPKAVCVTLGLLAMGPWMMNSLMDFLRYVLGLASKVGLS